jgi:hypothetical protein
MSNDNKKKRFKRLLSNCNTMRTKKEFLNKLHFEYPYLRMCIFSLGRVNVNGLIF